MLDYKLIEALAKVVQEGGFDKAAQQLHLTQSAVSQRVKLLEDQTGQILIIRSNPPTATPAGRQMIKHYLQVKRLEDDLVAAFSPIERKEFVVLSIGINEDSLATWFHEAIGDFLKRERVLLDLRPDDQQQTHQFLKEGEVMGCISSLEQPMQGCRIEYLGTMHYRMLATPDYMKKWLPNGLTFESIRQAPLLIFNRKDELHNYFFQKAIEKLPVTPLAHYVPSSEKFIDFMLEGLACGMVPEQQCRRYIDNGRLVELVPDCIVPVKLYWHYWNLKSTLLEDFTAHMVKNARKLLEQ